MDARAVLQQPHLTFVSGEPDADLQRIARQIEHRVVVDGRHALEHALERLLEPLDAGARVAPKTLDLIGHARPDGLLAIGDWVLDATRPTTTAFFRGMAEHDVLPRLGIHAVRLLGCNSAATEEARATLRALSDILQLEVYGARDLLHAGHYGATGFGDEWRFLLVAASDLRRPREGDAEPDARQLRTLRRARSAPRGPAAPYVRPLDIDALPAVVLGPSCAWPRRIASPAVARAVLALVRRRDGARMPSVGLAPSCELALPASEPGTYHVMHVLHDAQFVRVYPDAAGVVFPVDDAAGLRALLDVAAAG